MITTRHGRTGRKTADRLMRVDEIVDWVGTVSAIVMVVMALYFVGRYVIHL